MSTNDLRRDAAWAAVYLLLRHDRWRFKIGWSFRPDQRVRQLPEFDRGELDLEASRVIWLPSRSRAEQVERSLHKTFAPYRVEASHNASGFAEWFLGRAQTQAEAVMAQVPLGGQGLRLAQLVPLGVPHVPSANDDDFQSPLTVWMDLELLLDPLAQKQAITTTLSPEPTLTIKRIRSMPDRVGLDWMVRRGRLLDAETYQCREARRLRSFVKTMDFVGDDLVLRLTPLQQVARWPQGTTLAARVRCSLMRWGWRRVDPRSDSKEAA